VGVKGIPFNAALNYLLFVVKHLILSESLLHIFITL